MSGQKNGTSAKNGGTCTPYHIIHEPELCLPPYWNHSWLRYFCKTYVNMNSINGFLHVIYLTVSNTFRRNFRSCHRWKWAFVASLQLHRKNQYKIIFWAFWFPNFDRWKRGPGPLSSDKIWKSKNNFIDFCGAIDVMRQEGIISDDTIWNFVEMCLKRSTKWH